jgi:hypothetical protein
MVSLPGLVPVGEKAVDLWHVQNQYATMIKGNTRRAQAQNKRLLIFISYSHKDEEAREKLEIHLAQLKREGVATWFDGDMIPGDEIDPIIRRALRRADIFVALASPDYLHSNYCSAKRGGKGCM